MGTQATYMSGNFMAFLGQCCFLTLQQKWSNMKYVFLLQSCSWSSVAQWVKPLIKPQCLLA